MTFFGGRPRFFGGDAELDDPSDLRPLFDGEGLFDADLGGRPGPLFLGALDSLELADLGGRPRLRGDGVEIGFRLLGERPRFFSAEPAMDDFIDEQIELVTLASLFGRPLPNTDVVARRADTF